jgi:hypothetical protein
MLVISQSECSLRSLVVVACQNKGTQSTEQTKVG